MELVILIVLSLVVIFSAVFAVIVKSLTSAVIASGTVSLFASVIYILYAAPDVALTEAAIGSGLMTVVFFLVLSRMRRDENG
jgi:energy-converting hydrogenase B subunit D